MIFNVFVDVSCPNRRDKDAARFRKSRVRTLGKSLFCAGGPYGNDRNGSATGFVRNGAGGKGDIAIIDENEK